MRTWAIIISIFVILTLLAFTESIIINKFCDDIDKELSIVIENILSDNLTAQNLDSLYSVWQKNKTFVFALANHNVFHEFEIYINDLYYYKSTDNRERLYHSAECLKNANEHFKTTTSYNFENIF